MPRQWSNTKHLQGIVYSKCLGAIIENIENELYLGHRTVTRLYNNFIIEISFLAIKNGLVSI